MVNYKQILEAVNRGIKFALSDLEDAEELSSVSKLKAGLIEDAKYSTKDIIDLKKETVDLGLPSGTLWCKYNLGVNPKYLDNPENWIGDYYAWGELEPNKSCFTNDTYKFGYNKTNSVKADVDIKYNDNDNLTLLLPEDDAAYLNMHIGNCKCHIPTKELFEELILHCSSYLQKNYQGIKRLNGRIFKGTNGNELFIPYTCIKRALGSTLHLDGPYIWSSTVYIWDHNSAWHLDFEGGRGDMTSWDRYCGMPIRPVINL